MYGGRGQCSGISLSGSGAHVLGRNSHIPKLAPADFPGREGFKAANQRGFDHHQTVFREINQAVVPQGWEKNAQNLYYWDAQRADHQYGNRSWFCVNRQSINVSAKTRQWHGPITIASLLWQASFIAARGLPDGGQTFSLHFCIPLATILSLRMLHSW